MERLTVRSKNSDMVWFKDAENGNAHLWRSSHDD
jgi:hypothetical protein